MIKLRFIYICLTTIALFVSSLIIANMNFSPVYGSKVNDDKTETIVDPIKTAPQGLKIDSDTFHVGNFSKNSAQIVKSTNTETHDTDIVQITNDRNQLGAIWSNIDRKNYIDIDNEQTFSMWMYFGKESPNTKVGDGMALVLQNDSADAIASKDGKPLFGQTLGVWGGDYDNTLTDSKVVADMAIKNSWALEFDTFNDKNNIYKNILGLNNSFDYARNGQHIAYNYPDSPSTYQSSISFDPLMNQARRYFFTMNHNVVNDNTVLSDGNWHHLTMKWDPSKDIMHLAFNDKNLDGTDTMFNITKDIPIDLSHFKLKNNKLRWGFTGATGTEFEDNMVVFESIPSYVKAKTSTQIFNATQEKYLDKTRNGKIVNNGDQLNFIYNLKYLSGSKDWKDIFATIDLPGSMKYTEAKIIYGNGSTEEKIPISEIDKNKLIHKLQSNLSKTNPKAQIIISGIASSNMTSAEPATRSSFKGDSFIAYDELQDFTVKVNKQILISSKTESNIKLKQPKEVRIFGDVRYQDKSDFTYRFFNIHTILNDDKEIVTPMSNLLPKGSFVSIVDANKLRLGKNNLKLFVTDHANNFSNILNFEIQVGQGTLKFGCVDGNVSFQEVHNQRPGKIIPRQGKWQVEIMDDRPAQSSWKVQVHADPLFNGNTKFNGNIMYKDKGGHLNSLAEPFMIFYQTKDNDGLQRTNIPEYWKKDSGILLRLDNMSPTGEYTSKIYWELNDSL